MKTRIPTQAEYERNEMSRLHAQLREVDMSPLMDRQLARHEYQYTMANDPKLIGERIGWILEGNYGFGAMKKAEQILSSRGNKNAQLGQLLAALDFGCPASFAAQAWNKLSAVQQCAVNAHIESALAQ